MHGSWFFLVHYEIGAELQRVLFNKWRQTWTVVPKRSPPLIARLKLVSSRSAEIGEFLLPFQFRTGWHFNEGPFFAFDPGNTSGFSYPWNRFSWTDWTGFHLIRCITVRSF